jgi:hypothetical protein
MEHEYVEMVRDTASQQLDLLARLVDGRVGVVPKLDALARALSDGMWLTEVQFEERPDQTGASQVTMRVNGACFLDQAAKELGAIQAFEARVKATPALFDGFQAASVEQIQEQIRQEARGEPYSYRTFQLHCRSERRL